MSSGPLTDGPSLAGRVVLVTGAAGAIGRAAVAAFTAAGACCQAADLVPGEDTLACDVTDEASVAASIEAALSLGPLTDVVHAAGVVSVGPVAELRPLSSAPSWRSTSPAASSWPGRRPGP